ISAPPFQLRRNIQPAHLGHFNIGEEDVWLMREHRLEGVRAIARAGYDAYVAFNFEQCGQRPEDHALVFGDGYTDRLPPGFDSWIQWLPFPATARGNSNFSFVPEVVSRIRVPPNASMRSRIPLRPFPSTCIPPRPSSSMLITQDPF